MFKKITIGKTRAARKVACVFTEDLDRKDHTGIPVGIRPDFIRGISNPGFQAETGETAFVDDLLLLGLGSEDSIDADTARKAGAGLLAALDRAGVDAIEFVSRPDCDEMPLGTLGRAVAEGMGLANWRLDGFDGTNARERTTHPRLRIAAARKTVHDALGDGLQLAAAANLARMVGETPPNVCHPTWIAKQARKLARETEGLTCKVIDAKKAAELGMGGLINVGKASEIPPCMIQLEWKPQRIAAAAKKEHLVLIGKTITYDTGGYSLKISGGMRGMKHDMCGGAAVLGGMKAIADAGVPMRVTALLPAAENMISDEGYRPDDIITMYDGTTVEVTNTDAEGRLVLADALAYASDTLKPTAMVDMATLTGGVVVALGHFCAGLFCEHDDFRAAVESAAVGADEKVWRLPVWPEHREFMRSPVADILNSNPKRSAHPIQGAAFLSYFVKEEMPWAHIDIAGVADLDADPVTGHGSTGWGVRLLRTLAEGMASTGGSK
jgi:leucyl aminopeptidase